MWDPGYSHGYKRTGTVIYSIISYDVFATKTDFVSYGTGKYRYHIPKYTGTVRTGMLMKQSVDQKLFISI
jgi:hypothetical protein